MEFSDPANWEEEKKKLPATSGGGTNFGPPLVRAIQFFMLHKDINSCFVFLTDGQAGYPES